jgi:hypothetical protein
MADTIQLLAALKAMRAAYGTLYRGNCYITVAYEAKLAEVNRAADEAIRAAEQAAAIAGREPAAAN